MEEYISREKALSIPGISADGAAWLGRALHPADAMGSVNGCPTDGSAVTAVMHAQSTESVAPPANEVWDAYVTLCPNPIVLGKVVTTSYPSSECSAHSITNPNLAVGAWSEYSTDGQTEYLARYANFSRDVSAYRLIAAAVTVTMSAPATASQGVVTMGQYRIPTNTARATQYMNLTSATTATIYNANNMVAVSRIKPTSAALQSLPGSETWEAVKGGYAILKIGNDGFQWQSSGARARHYQTVAANPNTPETADGGARVVYIGQWDQTDAGVNSPLFWPEFADCDQVLTGTGATTSDLARGTPVLSPYQRCAMLHFEGLSPNAVLTVTMRCSFELDVPPGSIYVQQLTAPVVPDRVALESYYRIASRMKSAFPASFNAFGFLAPVLGRIARAVLPGIKSVGATALNSLAGSLMPERRPETQQLPLMVPAGPHVSTAIQAGPVDLTDVPRRRRRTPTRKQQSKPKRN